MLKKALDKARDRGLKASKAEALAPACSKTRWPPHGRATCARSRRRSSDRRHNTEVRSRPRPRHRGTELPSARRLTEANTDGGAMRARLRPATSTSSARMRSRSARSTSGRPSTVRRVTRPLERPDRTRTRSALPLPSMQTGATNGLASLEKVAPSNPISSEMKPSSGLPWQPDREGQDRLQLRDDRRDTRGARIVLGEDRDPHAGATCSPAQDDPRASA